MIDWTRTANATLTTAGWTNSRMAIHNDLVARAEEFGITDPNVIGISREGADSETGTTVVSNLGFSEWSE